MQAKTFKALGLLLCYPDDEWRKKAAELYELIRQEGVIPQEQLQNLRPFIDQLISADLLDLQEGYVDTFDRVRSLSLHLFEHVHGDSRERGQAMVDLAERYKEQGFTLAASELPDYLPVFLEYLSSLEKDEALEELSDTGAILAALGKRLAERDHPYHLVIDALTILAGKKIEKIERKVAASIDFAQMDKEWEEKPIEFLGAQAPNGSGCDGGGCGGNCAGSISPSPTQQSMMQGV